MVAVRRTDLIAKVARGRRLGSGGFGVVFETELAPHGVVAVKIIDRYDAEGKFRDVLHSSHNWTMHNPDQMPILLSSILD
jgi:hypothetical protein